MPALRDAGVAQPLPCIKVPQNLKFLAEFQLTFCTRSEYSHRREKSGLFSEVCWFSSHLAVDVSAPYIPVILNLACIGVS